jgi:hypothetical protein
MCLRSGHACTDIGISVCRSQWVKALCERVLPVSPASLLSTKYDVRAAKLREQGAWEVNALRSQLDVRSTEYGEQVLTTPRDVGSHAVAGEHRPAALARFPQSATTLRLTSRRTDRHMNPEKIKVRVTASGQMLDVVVLNKHLDRIQVVLGEGVHSVRCDLVPTRNGSAYVGNAMGREIVYERSREEVKADLARAAGFRDFRR